MEGQATDQDTDTAPTVPGSAMVATQSTSKRQPTARMLRKQARTRDHVLEVAERLYAEAGKGDLRMEDLADAANVSIGLIYGHFGSKDGVSLALADRALDGLSDYLDQAGDQD